MLRIAFGLICCAAVGGSAAFLGTTETGQQWLNSMFSKGSSSSCGSCKLTRAKMLPKASCCQESAPSAECAENVVSTPAAEKVETPEQVALAVPAGETLTVSEKQADQAGVRSGPQVGERVPGPFHPYNVNGESAGEEACLFCANGRNPVAVVFAREVTPELASLLKKLDKATVAKSDVNMGSYAVLLSDAKEAQEPKLKELAASQKLDKLVLTVFPAAGPARYKISNEADVTVLLYKDVVVEANHAFMRGQLDSAAIERVVADVSKITK